jgi:hypothetical protein
VRLPEPPPDASPWDLPPDLYERWEERVCIMHFDGRLPWRKAEALALADVLRHAGPSTDKAAPESAEAGRPAPAAAGLFVAESGPYWEGF